MFRFFFYHKHSKKRHLKIEKSCHKWHVRCVMITIKSEFLRLENIDKKLHYRQNHILYSGNENCLSDLDYK